MTLLKSIVETKCEHILGDSTSDMKEKSFRMTEGFLHFTNDCHFHFTQNEDAFICVCYVNSILHVTFIFIILDECVSRGSKISILVGIV